MNFQEFEDLAMFDLPQDPLSRRLVNHLFHTIRSRRIDEDWYIRPGTVIRCDTDPTEDRFESALFVALPHLRAQPYNGRSSPKGVGFCRERRLHDAFDQYSSVNLSINQEKGWYSRHDLGSDRNQIFWVGQVWLLLVGQSLLTYGSVSVDELEAGNITVQDEIIHAENGDRIIQIVDQDRRLFYIPSSKCKSFYELQVAMIHQFKRLGRADIKEYSLKFLLIDGQEITSSKWSAILKQPDLPLVKVTLSPIEVHHDDTSSLTASRHSRTSDDDKLSLDISEPSGDSDDSSSDEGGSESDSESGSDQDDSKSDSMGFLLIDTESITTTHEHSVPNLNRRVPPFLSWLIRATDGKERNIANGFRESISRIELMLIRVDEKQYSDELMESLTSAFGIADFYDETANLDYEEFRYLRASFQKGKLLRGSSSMSDLSDDLTLKLADEYLDVALLTLESFISIEFSSKLTQKFFGALADIMKDPTFSLQLYSSDAPDPDIPDTFRHDKKLRWVLSRKRIRGYDQRERRQAPENAKCEECETGTVYSSMESAIAHFRKSHMVGSMTDSNIRIFVLPLAAALEERLAEEQSSLLQGARDAMVSILRKLVSIQDGVTYDNEFREQRGLPLYLLQAITWIFLYVCSVSRVLHELSWFYKDDLCQKDPKNLASSKIRTQLNYLTRISSKVEDLVRKAERELASPTTAVEENGPGSFLISVGQHYVATRVICNLLRTPIHNNKHIVPIYQALTKKLASQIIRNPTKRQILSIGALIDQLRLVKDFYEWQWETLYYFDLVINPDSYPRGYDHAEREKLFSDHEYGLISWEDKKLEKDIHQISQLLLACDRMVGKVRELTDIMKDDQGRAIFIFTTVTIIFLPLSFVATYIGMSGGATGLDWSGIQSLFWEVSGPLTFGILMFCLFVAQKENILNAIPLSLVEKMRGWRDWSGWKARGEWETEYEPTEKDMKLDTCYTGMS
ncbi:hypothetical protein F4821DRAFT_40137 [Hypoxylon rubiginosum]|uniref:Uncharacterized protein n=1 Tax=Hypoxylon rubiginosum TaxID=110542 RepID=A0ACC0CKL5_9PEZI|nr:hypothetical protein F4821DRAFT_40137 [Hypoxylon rubiginosum]